MCKVLLRLSLFYCVCLVLLVKHAFTSKVLLVKLKPEIKQPSTELELSKILCKTSLTSTKPTNLIIFCGSFFWDICHFWLYDGNSQQGSRKEKGEKSEGGTVAIKTKAKALIAR